MSSIREFATGATRDQNASKYDFGGFTCPLVLERFAEYMHKHRVQPDGTLRASDNWKKGIPLAAYAESEWRHHLDFQKAHQGLPAPDIEDSICALIFNLQGYLHELLKAKPLAQGAYRPEIFTTEEATARLEAMLAGQDEDAATESLKAGEAHA